MGLVLRIIRYLSLIVFLLVSLIAGLNYWMIISTEDQIYYDYQFTPENKVGIVLGTSKRTTQGLNKFFSQRIEAASELYHQNKIRHIIVSGDNRTVYYNEPRDMYQALVDKNIPKSAITLDFGGLRTLDTIVRADSIFGQKKFTIITQDFHCYRSLFIANFYGLDVIAYSADNKDQLPYILAGREILARFAAVLDLYVWNKAPSILGEKEKIDL